MHWLTDLTFFMIWIVFGVLMIYGAYHERRWLSLFFKFPSLAWLRQRYGKENVRIFTIIFGVIWIIFGLRFALDKFLATDIGRITLIGIIIVIFLVSYFAWKQSHNGERNGNP